MRQESRNASIMLRWYFAHDRVRFAGKGIRYLEVRALTVTGFLIIPESYISVATR
jgi:hypothetical protein